MRYLIFLILLSNTHFIKAQEFKSVKFDQIDKVLETKNDTTYIINFWATWCKPCVEEIPFFEVLTEKYKSEKFKVLLVSMDFKSDVENRLIPFLEKKKYKSEVWWFDEQKQNQYIEKIEEKWYGEIPFTIVRKGSENRRYWKAGKWKEEELFNKVDEFL